MRWAICAVVACGCGRIGFDSQAPCWPARMAGTPYANSDEGADGVTTPFLICTADQLGHISAHPEHWAAAFALARDLDVGGGVPMIAGPFTGSFDGGGHALANLSYDLPSTSNVGLFATANPGARFANLALHAVAIHGAQFVGALVGYGQGVTIDEVSVDGTLSGSDSVGGVIGGVECYGRALLPTCAGIAISNVTADVDVTGSDAGGVIGYTYSDSNVPTAQLTGLVSSGTVTGGSLVGGLVGDGEAITLTQSSSTATVSGTGTVGGLVGDVVYVATLIAQSSASGTVTCTTGTCGGIVGELENGSLANCHASGTVICGSGSTCGGAIGDGGHSITASYATGDVSGLDQIGGLAGDAYEMVVRDSYATGAVTGRNQVGGLIGDVAGSDAITDTYSTSHVQGQDAVGGLIGALEAGTSITDSFATGSVVGMSPTGRVGFLIGSAGGTLAGTFYAATSTCTTAATTCTPGGTPVASPSNFYSSANPPLTSWDFVTVWMERPGGYPGLR